MSATSFTVTTDGGLTAATRVVTMLRARCYQVRRLSIDISRDGRSARVAGHVHLDAGQHALLQARLERLPTVLDVRVTA